MDNKTNRRQFLSMLSATAAIGLIGHNGVKGISLESQNDTSKQSFNDLPTITLGNHKLSRLICGSNPILGYSYMGPHADRNMKEYFTTERTVEFLQECEQAGITAHQLSSRSEYVPFLRDRGSNLKIICLHSQRENIQEAIDNTKPIALAHHGGVSDRLFAAGDSEVVHDYVKAVKDAGLLAGVSAHNPDVIKQIANEGWEVDFFMTCFYYLTRKITYEEPMPVLPLGTYNFYKNDPELMTQVIRQVKQPCLAFKILGSGRLCSSQEKVRTAFQYAFENIKPTDCVIIGMFPRYFDEIGANTQFTLELGKGK